MRLLVKWRFCNSYQFSNRRNLGLGMRQPYYASMVGFRWLRFLILAVGTITAQTDAKHLVTVPEQVAALLQPILDLRQQSITECGQPGKPSRKTCLSGIGHKREQQRWWKVGEGIAHLASQKTAAADEALVVLMCYYTGESGDNEDAVINRGRRELPYLLKYRKSDPVIPEKKYSDSMRLNREAKTESFQIAITAIRKGEKRD